MAAAVTVDKNKFLIHDVIPPKNYVVVFLESSYHGFFVKIEPAITKRKNRIQKEK